MIVLAHAHRFFFMQCLCALAISLPIASAHAYDWLQFAGDAQHSGRNTAETAITPNNVSALVQKYQVTLPATADGAPVFLEAVNTPIGTKDLLFVTTRDGRIIALDAQSGAQVWARQYGPGTCQINLTGGACYTTSSPAIDPNRQYVYSYGLDGNVHKYQVGDGTEIIGGGWPQLTTLKGFDEKGSSALAIATSNGTTYLYVVHGGYPGDNGDYQGHVTAINLGTGAQKVFNAACSDQAVHFKRLADGVPPTCSTPRNAIWSRPGVIYDVGTNRIFMGTGNGVYNGNNNGRNWSESVIALNPDGSGGTGVNAGKPLDSYTPANFQNLDNGDTDLGSTAPAILPVPANSTVQNLAVQSGKDSKLRLINLANLSGQGGPGHVGGEVGTVINVPQGGVVLTQPAVWINPADGTTWVFVVNGNGASGLQLVVDVNGNPSLAPRWQNVQGGTSPIVANNMVFSISGSTVRALDPLSGSVLWSLARSGGFHWESLIVAKGVVYATDSSNRLTAFAIATSVTLNVTPTSVAGNGTLTASWSGISGPTSTDWIGLFVPGVPSGSYIDWIYVSCSKTPGAPVAAGSCPFVLPNVAPGTYELRLFANNGFTVIAQSNTFTVTGSTSLTVTPTSVAGNGTLTASWSGITAPTSTDWIGLFVPGAAAGSYIDWIYVSCSKTPGAPAAAGSCPFVLPNVAPGTYELRLLANNGSTVLAQSNTFTVTGGASLNVTPTSVAGNGTLTASWSGISGATATDWIGLFVPGAPSGSYIDWIYVSCSKTPSGPIAAGSCPFVLPNVAPGTYELRLFANNGFTVLATSNTFTVTP